MRVLCALLCALVCVVHVQGELLAALRALHTADAFHYLTADEQVLLVELIAAAEACKLSAYEHSVGRQAIVELIIHLPGTLEHHVQTYLHNHLTAEQHGTCRVDGGATTTATTTHRPVG